MNAAVRLFRQLCARAAVATSLAYVTSQPVQAALPSVEPPSSGGGGSLMDTIKGYFPGRDRYYRSGRRCGGFPDCRQRCDPYLCRGP